MEINFIVGQAFGIVGLVLMAISYQSKGNKSLFVMQALSGLAFAVNFVLIKDISAALFNVTNLFRGLIFAKTRKRIWEVVTVEALYTACFAFSLINIWGIWLDVFLSCFTFTGLAVMTFVMWRANSRHIRYTQLFLTSPSWLVNNFFHFTLGGILCEVFAMCSVIVSFIRYRKNGFENN